MSGFDAALAEDTGGALVPAFPNADLARTEIHKKFLEQVRSIQAEAGALTVTDDVTFKGAIALAGRAKEIASLVEKARKAAVEEPNAYVKAVNSACKALTEPLDAATNGLKGKINQHQRKIELARQEQERKAREAVEKENARLAKLAAKKGLDVPPVTVVAPVVQKETVHRAESGASVHMRKSWKWELMNRAVVPDEYLMLDEKAVNAAVKAGIRQIVGIRIFEAEDTVLKF